MKQNGMKTSIQPKVRRSAIVTMMALAVIVLGKSARIEKTSLDSVYRVQ